MHLTKYHGLGNDFLVALDRDDRASVDARAARELCDRRRGIGADGVIVVGPPSSGADVTMTLFNADGSVAEMSGNGIRCLGHALARRAGTVTFDVTVATGGGVRRVHVGPGPDAVTAWVEVDMGTARPGPSLDPGMDMGMDHLKVTSLDLGNPHLVVLVGDLAAVDMASVGPACQRSFARGVNVEAIAPTPGRDDALDLVVWERGVGLTQACGTGACAAAHAAYGWGLVGERVAVRMPGGDVEVVLGDTITLAGPSVFVADIEAADIEVAT
ncbi:MAG: diaminopimelate epimerase [Acidimicrobiales bacterium]